MINIVTYRLFFILLMVLAGVSCAPGEKKNFSEAVWEKQVKASRTADLYAPHYENGRYFAPWMKMPKKNFLDVLWWKLFVHPDYSTEEKNYLPGIERDAARRIQAVSGNFILWIGHNSFLVRIGETYWLTDPIFTKRALVPARVTPPALTADEINKIAEKLNILISHNHYDHLDRESIKALFPEASVYVPMGLKALLLEMNKTRVTEMDWWQETDLGADGQLICLPAQHWSLRIGQSRNSTLWASWMLVTPEVTLYFGGDSGYFKGFREIGDRFKKIDYAFLATTAYHPRWFMYYQHMNIPEALKAFDDLRADCFIPTQWGTFPLGSEPPGFPGLDLRRQIRSQKRDIRKFRILDIGQILTIPKQE